MTDNNTTTTTVISATNSKPSAACIHTMTESIKLFNKIIIQHYIDDEIREKKEAEEWAQQKQERSEKRERWATKFAEKEKERKERAEKEAQERAEKGADESEEDKKKREQQEEDRKKKEKEEDEEDEDNIPEEAEFEKHRDFVLKRRPPPRSNHEMRKQLFRMIKSLISNSINSEPSRAMAASPVIDELLSISAEYLTIFRDVGMAVVVCSFACNLSAHTSVRNLIDATALVEWFLEIALLFNALKRIVHLCLLGISNAAMCRDLRLNDEMTKNFAATICRLHGETRVVEAWSCAVINLVGASKTANGSMLLKHDVFSMLQRLVTIHGTDDQTAARGIQALTCLSLVQFPAKPAGNAGAVTSTATSTAASTANPSVVNSTAGSPNAKNPATAAASSSSSPQGAASAQ